VLLAAAGGFVICIGYALVVTALFPPSLEQRSWVHEVAGTNGLPRHLFAFMALIAAPLVEEFMFRGVLFSGLRRAMPPWAAALITSALFTLIHLTSFTQPYWAGLSGIFAVSLGLQTARMLTNSLVPGMAMHLTYNSVVVMGLYAFA
jgi:membrane protease YdiL (CAAX protease family)